VLASIQHPDVFGYRIFAGQGTHHPQFGYGSCQSFTDSQVTVLFREGIQTVPIAELQSVAPIRDREEPEDTEELESVET